MKKYVNGSDSKVGLFTGSGKKTEPKSGDCFIFSYTTARFKLIRRGRVIKFGKTNGSNVSPVKFGPQFIVVVDLLATSHGLRAVVDLERSNVQKLIIYLR